jgi:hypothetical protein
MFAETKFHPNVPDAVFRRFLRCPSRRTLDGELAENAEWARAWFAAHARPWFCVRVISVEHVQDAGVNVARCFAGGVVGDGRLCGATSIAVVAASSGPESETEATERWSAGDFDRSFFLESYGAAVVAQLVVEARRRLLEALVDHTIMPGCGPGYRGWPLSDMAAVLGVMQEPGPLPGPLSALNSGMLVPRKSQLVMYGLRPRTYP